MKETQKLAKGAHWVKKTSESLRRDTAQNSERTANERSISTDTGKSAAALLEMRALRRKCLAGEARFTAITCL